MPSGCFTPFKSCVCYSPKSKHHKHQAEAPAPAPVVIAIKKPAPNPSMHKLIWLQYHTNRSSARLAQFKRRVVDHAELSRMMHSRIESVMMLQESGASIGGDQELMSDVACSTIFSSLGQPLSSASGSTTGATSRAAGSTTGGASRAPGSTVAPSKTTRHRGGSIGSASQSGNVSLLDQHVGTSDIAYGGTIQVGTPLRDYSVIFDTGSSDFWLPSSTEARSQLGNHHSLGSDVSSTFRNTGHTFSITYGSGYASGFTCQDSVSISGKLIQGLDFAVVNCESSDFTGDSPFDGLLGLGQQALSTQNVPTPVDALHNRGLIAEAVVGVSLGRAADGGSGGEISFGHTDPSKYVGNITYLKNVSTDGFWELALDDVLVNGVSIGIKNKGRTAIMDTGTTLIIAPPADADALTKMIPGAMADMSGGYTIPTSHVPTVSLVFGGVACPINPRDLAFESAGQGTAIFGISAGVVDPNAMNEWLVGDVFLKNVYTVFNTTRNQIGLAVAKKDA